MNKSHLSQRNGRGNKNKIQNDKLKRLIGNEADGREAFSQAGRQAGRQECKEIKWKLKWIKSLPSTSNFSAIQPIHSTIRTLISLTKNINCHFPYWIFAVFPFYFHSILILRIPFVSHFLTIWWILFGCLWGKQRDWG